MLNKSQWLGCALGALMLLGPTMQSAHATLTVRGTRIGCAGVLGVCYSGGTPGTLYSIEIYSGNPPVLTTVLPVTGPPTGTVAYIRVPAGRPGDVIRVAGKGSSSVLAQVWNPPNNSALATHAVTGGSVDGPRGQYALSGEFRARFDTLDSNEASNTYGQIGGAVLASDFTLLATNEEGGTVRFTLTDDQAVSANMAALLDSPVMTGHSMSFALPVNGIATVSDTDGVTTSTPFAGLVTGTTSINPDPDVGDSYEVQFTFGTDLGDFTGTVSTIATGELIDNCPCQADNSDAIDIFDILTFLTLWFNDDPAADLNADNLINVFDLLTFLDCWFPASESANGSCGES